MSTSVTTAPGTTGMAEFERTTSRWGRLTMIAGLVFSLAGPLYLVFFADLGVTATQLFGAFAAVAGTFFVIWLVEPLTYFPILGPASMYQAFMIGNISNKLLPSALIAQTNINAKPGTPRGSLAAVMAICGAASVHLLSLLVFVGILGTWLISIVPPEVTDVVRVYVLPSVMGAVIIQAIVSLKQVRATIVAFVVAILVLFVLVPLVPALSMVATAIVVITTLVIGWFVRKREGNTGQDVTPEAP
ncbi:hypothetical protein E7744_02510 [Citricoccus sp. SGAir0253]|uniref:hypothetical protein n=1 Tax=Citricoccus sp. SGAir0253 TaxID=2567881 RepID=UPI0010CCF909|nr:hypothetical protein [Citricoccus sp. SGAir0253]QCU77213.1 hypothetical protein E7744_02510 [Citricoccus sp. SGAir0253]